MAYERLTDDLDIISKLDTEPNDVGGLSAEELKAKFDEAGNAIKTYINETLLPSIEGENGAENTGIETIGGISSATNVQDALIQIVQLINDISQGSVPDGSITTQKLADGAVTNGKLDVGSVGTLNLAGKAVTAEKLADLAITAAKLAAKCVTSAKIADNAVGSGQIADGAVTNGKLASNAVQTGNIYEKAVGTSKIADKAVTVAKINDEAVTSAKLANGSVTADKLEADAVTNGKIAANAVTSGKIAANAVSSLYTATLNATWSGSAAPYSKVQTISGILASDYPIVDLVPSSTYATAVSQEQEFAKIYRIVASANTLTFYAKEKPTVSLPIKVLCVRK